MIRKATFAFVFVTVLLDMLALGIIVPVLPKLILQFKGGDSAGAAAAYGAFGTLFAAMQFFFAPLLGALSDRFGRRPAILLSNFGLGFDYILMALAPTLPWLYLGRAISGVCSATFSIPSAYISDVVPSEKRAASFGMLGAAFGLGFVVGPAFGGLLGAANPRLPFWVAAALSLANACYGLFILPESLPKEKRFAVQWRKANPIGAFALLRKYPAVLSLAAVAALSFLAHEVLPSMWVLYSDYRYHWTTRMAGLMLAAVGVASVIVQGGLIRPAVAKLGERRALLMGLTFGAIGFYLYGAATTAWVFCLGIPFGALWGFAGPSAQAIMTKRVDATEQGRLQGALAGVRGLTGMIGPFLFTHLFAWSISGTSSQPIPGLPFLLAGSLLAVAIFVAFFAAREPAAA